jgi:hypothetical protein
MSDAIEARAAVSSSSHVRSEGVSGGRRAAVGTDVSGTMHENQGQM